MRWSLVLAPLIICLSVTGGDFSICGDVNGDNNGPDVADVTYLVDYLFVGGPPPPSDTAADCNGDDQLNVSDLTWLVDYLFRGGFQPICDQIITSESMEDCPHYKSEDGLPESQASELIQYGSMKPSTDRSKGTMYAELIAGDLHVYHNNAYYQCCLGYMVTLDEVTDRIVLIESDTAEDCGSMCYFDLEWVIEDIWLGFPMLYTVILIGIDGDTVGTFELDVSPEGEMHAEVMGNILHVYQNNSWYNCCPTWSVDYQIGSSYINIYRRDLEGTCPCVCMYQFQYDIYGLDPGQYVVAVIGGDQYGDWLIGVDTVVVGGR